MWEAGAGRWSRCVKDICDNYAAIGADDTVVIDHNAPVWCAGFIGKAIRWPGTHNIAFFLSDCLYMLPFVFGHRTLQSGISSFCHEIWRKILKELVKLEIVSVWMNKDYLPNWPDCRHQVSYQVSWRCCRVRAGWGSGSNLKGVSTGARMQTSTAWMTNQHPLCLSGMWMDR